MWAEQNPESTEQVLAVKNHFDFSKLVADSHLTKEEKKTISEAYRDHKEALLTATKGELREFILKDYGAANFESLGWTEGIRELQTKLWWITVDGFFGPDTFKALIEYQKQNQLSKIDGIAGPETLKSLGILQRENITKNSWNSSPIAPKRQNTEVLESTRTRAMRPIAKSEVTRSVSDYQNQNQESNKRTTANTQAILESVQSAHIELSKKIEKLTEKEQSFMNFVSPENMLGFSTRILSGDTVTGLKLQGLQDFSKRNSASEKNLKIILDNLQNNKTFTEIQTIPALKIFFASPEGVYTIDKENGLDDQLCVQKYILNTARLYKNLGLPIVAEWYYDKLDGTIFESQVKGERLSKIERFQRGWLTDFANDFLSYDQLLIMAAGWSIGKWIGYLVWKSARLTQAAVVVGAAIEWSKIAKTLLPGVQVVESGNSENLLIRIGKWVINIGVDITKFIVYQQAAEAIGWEDAGKAVSLALALIPGAKAWFESQIGVNIAKDALSDIPKFANGIITKYGKKWAEEMIYKGLVEQATVEAMKTGKFSKGLSSPVLAEIRDIANGTANKLEDLSKVSQKATVAIDRELEAKMGAGLSTNESKIQPKATNTSPKWIEVNKTPEFLKYWPTFEFQNIQEIAAEFKKIGIEYNGALSDGMLLKLPSGKEIQLLFKDVRQISVDPSSGVAYLKSADGKIQKLEGIMLGNKSINHSWYIAPANPWEWSVWVMKQKIGSWDDIASNVFPSKTTDINILRSDGKLLWLERGSYQAFKNPEWWITVWFTDNGRSMQKNIPVDDFRKANPHLFPDKKPPKVEVPNNDKSAEIITNQAKFQKWDMVEFSIGNVYQTTQFHKWKILEFNQQKNTYIIELKNADNWSLSRHSINAYHVLDKVWSLQTLPYWHGSSSASLFWVIREGWLVPTGTLQKKWIVPFSWTLDDGATATNWINNHSVSLSFKQGAKLDHQYATSEAGNKVWWNMKDSIEKMGTLYEKLESIAVKKKALWDITDNPSSWGMYKEDMEWIKRNWSSIESFKKDKIKEFDYWIRNSQFSIDLEQKRQKQFSALWDLEKEMINKPFPLIYKIWESPELKINFPSWGWGTKEANALWWVKIEDIKWILVPEEKISLVHRILSEAGIVHIRIEAI
jgi:peptidoglycan hydrolase-like protein with peptidoglycan-binding domain